MVSACETRKLAPPIRLRRVDADMAGDRVSGLMPSDAGTSDRSAGATPAMLWLGDHEPLAPVIQRSLETTAMLATDQRVDGKLPQFGKRFRRGLVCLLRVYARAAYQARRGRAARVLPCKIAGAVHRLRAVANAVSHRYRSMIVIMTQETSGVEAAKKLAQQMDSYDFLRGLLTTALESWGDDHGPALSKN